MLLGFRPMLVRGKGYGLINPVKVHFTALKVAAIVYHAIALHFFKLIMSEP